MVRVEAFEFVIYYITTTISQINTSKYFYIKLIYKLNIDFYLELYFERSRVSLEIKRNFSHIWGFGIQAELKRREV